MSEWSLFKLLATKAVMGKGIILPVEISNALIVTFKFKTSLNTSNSIFLSVSFWIF